MESSGIRSSMKKAVIFDLNGVFIKSPLLSQRFEYDFGVQEDRFLDALKKVMAEVRQPNAPSVFSLWEPYFKEWGIRFTEEEFLNYWFGVEGEDEEMFQIARDLKEKGVKIYILSNNFTERAKYYKQNFQSLGTNLRDVFDKVYYSWETGYLKPNPRAYTHILEDQGLQPEECIYFDDSNGNVGVANGLGIKSFLFRGPEETRGTLEMEGML